MASVSTQWQFKMKEQGGGGELVKFYVRSVATPPLVLRFDWSNETEAINKLIKKCQKVAKN